MDWTAFFDAQRIPYVTSGPNTSKNQVSLPCPWCGLDDTSEHLSVNLLGKGFRCWRNPSQHSGKNPARLIQALLKCSWDEANRLAGHENTLPSDFLGRLKAAFTKPEKIEQKVKLTLPPEFKTFSNLPSSLPYNLYLRARGFSNKDIAKAKGYGIYYASQGLYKGRVIFTVVKDGGLVGFTGRTIYKSNQVRYSTLTSDREKAAERGETPAPEPISSFLLFFDHVALGGDTIVLCEGPFDAWRVNLLGSHVGIVATCFFTSMLSDQQKNLLHEILPKFDRRILLLDQNTFTKSTRIKSDLITLGVETCMLPEDIKDPAELLSTKELQGVLN